MLAPSKKRTNLKPGRLEYLGLLTSEFRKTESKDARRQVLANLANFAYDPCNYNYFRLLGVVDLLLNLLSDPDEIICQFSIGGLCNLCLDPKNKEHILKSDGVKQIIKLFEYKNENILLSTITTLIYLITPESKKEITDVNIIRFMINLCKENNSRLKNLAEIFLEDYCTKKQIEEVTQNLCVTKVQDIPLPHS